MAQSYKIDIHSATNDDLGTELFSILEGLMPVKFGLDSGNGSSSTGEILVGELPGRANRNGTSRVSNLAVPECGKPGEADKLTSLKVFFADDPAVPFPFRGRSLTSKVAVAPKILSASGREKVLAKTEHGPVWSVSDDGGKKYFRSGFSLPTIPAQGSLFDVLNGDRFLEMLPLLHFLRGICEDGSYAEPPVRAQFMFDDPNLHWPRYGYVGYRETAARAERENYHVSFATIPLDAWFIHGRTAEIFRSHQARLSLCVHGNDHTKRELAQNYSPSARAALLKQALRRIGRLEKKSGVPVSRVMVPPHGAALHEMLEELPHRGFEAACISHGSLRAHNKTRAWTKSLGYLPSELIGDCPVLPRWGLANSSENTVFLAAYLRQPIVLRGHHQDIKDGIEVLDGFARIINSLGNVIWSDMADISRRNYFSRREGSTFRVKPLGRKLTVHLPETASTLLIENPAHPSWTTWQISPPNGLALEVRSSELIPVPGKGKRTVTIETVTPSVAPVANGASRVPVVAFLRRLLTEGRDRVSGAYGSI